MIWFFTRGSAQIDIEVRRLANSGVFELIVDYPDGSEGVERFTNARKLVKRTLSLQHRLIRGGWIPNEPGMRRGARVPRRPARRSLARWRQVPRLWDYVQRHVRERIAATLGL